MQINHDKSSLVIAKKSILPEAIWRQRHKGGIPVMILYKKKLLCQHP
jgi:hypothetical protein